MRYLGGKSRIAKQLAAKIHELVPDADLFWDPFCGGLSMSVALAAHGRVISSDACAPLIALYQAVRNGWDPPTEVSRETYQAAKSLPDSDPMKAFCGFGCSFGGMWFGSYVEPVWSGVVSRGPRAGEKQTQRPHAACAAKIKTQTTATCAFACVDWLTVDPRPIGAVKYLDPPYAGTTGYRTIGAFDHDAFVLRAIEWSRFAHVFVSEYAFPVGECVWERSLSVGLQGAQGGLRVQTERLYYLPKGFAR